MCEAQFLQQRQKTRKQKDCLSNFHVILDLIISLNGEIHNRFRFRCFNLCNSKIIVIVLTRENFEKETTESEYIEQSLNGHTTSNSLRFDVDITSIRWRPNFDGSPCHFHVLFRCNFADRKIHLVSTYFFQRNFTGRKIHVVSMYFFQCNFAGRKIHVVSTHFFKYNFDGRKI